MILVMEAYNLLASVLLVTLPTRTLSVVNQTSLDPGLQYCVRVAGRTSAGVGPFSQTLIPCMCSYLVFIVYILMQPWFVITSDRIH